MKLAKDDLVITAFAERADGPGWANQPVRVIVQSPGGALRQEWLQPEELTHGMQTLYRVSQAAHLAMVAEVKSKIWR